MSNQKPQFEHPTKNANRRTAWIVAGVSSLFCALLIALLFAISKDDTTLPAHVQSEDVIDLLETPKQEHINIVNIDSDEIGIELPRGGWVQQTDANGNLTQQYRCENLDPNPTGLPGWIEMKKPEVELYLGDNKLVRITGDIGIAHAPKRTLESGEISGHVVIQMFELDEMQHSTNPIPEMEMQTVKATFDNFIGEIMCPNEVRISSPSQTLKGRNLSVRFNDLEERIEYLHLTELDYIELLPTQPEKENQIYTTNSFPTQVADANRARTRNVKATAVGDDIEYFIVTLSDNITILQGNQLDGRMARGNRLTIAFSNESKTSRTTPLEQFEQPSPPPAALHSIPTTLVATAVATASPDNSQEPVRITCDGGLTMVPLDDPALIPSTISGTRIELFAFDDAPAKLIDTSQDMTATGSLLRYELQEDRTDLFGSPATLLMNSMVTSSEHLWIAKADGLGGAEGEGTMVSTQEGPQTSLQWSEGVDFFFEASTDDTQGALQEVVCHGDVVLTDNDSQIHCQALAISFVTNDEGSSSPSLAVATGNVKATSNSQTLWANDAEVTFTNELATKPINSESMFGGSSADKMNAKGDVQILLEDGGRAFCNSLEGNITQDSVALQGNVVIAYERMLMNRGDTATLTLDRASGKGKWLGSGQAIFLNTPLDISQDERIERPEISKSEETNSTQSISMRANWSREMSMDQKFNDGAGSIHLEGNVNVSSQQSPHERSKMTGDDLRLEFENIEYSEDEDIKKKRDLKKVIARNNAQIEHRTWEVDHPELLPIVYYIGGNHLEFDTKTQEALAVGDGELVLRNPRDASNEVHQSSLAGRGTTRFTWDNKLRTTQLKDNRYRLEMTGQVEMIHKGLDGSIGMLTSDQIEAIAIDPESPEAVDEDGAQLTMRGMDLQQLNATGSVYVATETRRVDCDHFDYNLKTGLAKLTADKNRSVAVVTEGSPYPVRASSIIWNMDPSIDTISIRDLQSTGSN